MGVFSTDVHECPDIISVNIMTSVRTPTLIGHCGKCQLKLYYIFKKEQNKPQQVIHVTPHNPSSAVKNHQSYCTRLSILHHFSTALLSTQTFISEFGVALIRMVEQKVLVCTYVLYVCIFLIEREREIVFVTNSCGYRCRRIWSPVSHDSSPTRCETSIKNGAHGTV